MPNSLLHKRNRAEKRFKLYGLAALATAIAFLAILLLSIGMAGYSAFFTTEIRLPIVFEGETLGITATDSESLAQADYAKTLRQSLQTLFPEIEEARDKRKLAQLVSTYAQEDLRAHLTQHPEAFGQTAELWLKASDSTDMIRKGKQEASSNQQAWLSKLEREDRIRTRINWHFFTKGDSREPEAAGFGGSMVGSLLTVFICMLVAFPLGVLTAVHLEEFKRRSRVTDFIEVNINNLAAVPSIVFGLLGLALYLGFLGLARSSPIAGGLTLSMMILPTMIIATRASLAAVPQSLREAAIALGASRIQMVWHHVLPAAFPGIVTGAILSIARAIGETAPLMMIGMVAFIADVPTGFTSPATAMPVQIFLWSDSPEMGFAEKTAGGILILLVILIAMNATAMYVRKRYEIRW